MDERWRGRLVVLIVVAMLAWSAYGLFFLLLLGTPSIEGAEEVARQARLMIGGGWLAGLVVGAAAVIGLRRRTFDETPSARRVVAAIVGLGLIATIVVAAYWMRAPAPVLFLWGPLALAGLLLVGWASAPRMRRRLLEALVIFGAGCLGIAALWFGLPPGSMQFGLWQLLALVAVVAATWWALGLARRRHARS